MTKERNDLKKQTEQQQSELQLHRTELENTQTQLKKSRVSDSRLIALLSQYKALISTASSSPSSTASSTLSSSSSPLPVIQKCALSELKLLARGGSKAVHRCLYAKSPAAYYCFLDGETALRDSSKIKQEFEQEVAALTKPALLQHPNILKVFAVRSFLFLLNLSKN
jgi:hypothetical protein